MSGEPREDVHLPTRADAVDDVVGSVAVDGAGREPVRAGGEPTPCLLDDLRHGGELRQPWPRRPHDVRRVLDVEEPRPGPDDVGEANAGVSVNGHRDRARACTRACDYARDRGGKRDEQDPALRRDPDCVGSVPPHANHGSARGRQNSIALLWRLVTRFQFDHGDDSAGLRLEFARRGAAATIAAKAASRSAPLRILAVAASVSEPTSTVTHGSRSRLRKPGGILRGATVRGDDAIATATPVVGERCRAWLTARRVDRREQEERHVRQLATHDAAVRPERADHGLVEAARSDRQSVIWPAVAGR